MGKHPGGRPPKYKAKEEMQKKINKYFEECDYKNEPYTVTGLAMALDMSRQALVNYEGKDEFVDTIKKAKMKVEEYLERRLIRDSSVTGIIFNLKNNYDWRDKQEIEHSGTIKLEDVL